MEESEDVFTYFVGAPAIPDTVSYDDFVTWELPAGEYIACSFEAENFEQLTTSALGKAMSYLYSVWLPGHNLTTQPFSVERYEPSISKVCKMEIWVLPSKESKP
jgi:AraC family transcriptional regulator